MKGCCIMAGSHMIAENSRKVVPYGRIRTVSVFTDIDNSDSKFNYEFFFEVNPYSRFVISAEGNSKEEVVSDIEKQMDEYYNNIPVWSQTCFDILNDNEEPEVELVSRRDLNGKIYSFEKVLEKDNVELFKGNVKEDLYSKYYFEIKLENGGKISIYSTGSEEESSKNRLINEINKYMAYIKEDLDWAKEYLKEDAK